MKRLKNFLMGHKICPGMPVNEATSENKVLIVETSICSVTYRSTAEKEVYMHAMRAISVLFYSAACKVISFSEQTPPGRCYLCLLSMAYSAKELS